MEEGARESSTDSEIKDDTSYHLTAIVSEKRLLIKHFPYFNYFRHGFKARTLNSNRELLHKTRMVYVRCCQAALFITFREGNLCCYVRLEELPFRAF